MMNIFKSILQDSLGLYRLRVILIDGPLQHSITRSHYIRALQWSKDCLLVL